MDERRDLDRTVIHVFGRDFQASSLIAAALWFVGAGVALAVGLTAWGPGKALAAVFAVIALAVAWAG